MASNPGLLISEIFTNPTGNDSPFEYVELIATQAINFSTSPYSVVFEDTATTPSNGWITGGAVTYGFNITSGTVNAGDIVYVGGSSMSPTGTKLRTINTATTNGDRFGNVNINGVLGNGGSNADGVAVFAADINTLSSSTVPIDAIIFGNSIGSAAISSTVGLELPINDRYSGGKLQSTSYVAPDSGNQALLASGTFNTTTNTFTAPRSWTVGAATPTSAITFFTPSSGAAPTIQVASTTTKFLNLSFDGVSGVINDPTDPARTLGIDFTIADSDTPIANLLVTVATSNASVVNNSNLALTGTGATRNLKITPTGVGFANITVNVSDGTNNTSYIINYAASDNSGTSTTRFLTGTSDGSTAIAIDSNYMLIGDDENQVLRLYDRSNSGLPIAGFDFTTSLGLTDISGGIPREVDIEASTKIGNRIYWMGSESNNDTGSPRINRNRIFATDISGTGASTTLSYVSRYDFLREDIIAWDQNNGHGKGANYYGLAASGASGVSSKVPEGYNIEGLEMAPDNTTAYIAFRAPEVPPGTRSKALIVPVTNFTSLLSISGGTQGSATFGTPIELDLGGRGIREIRKNAANQYLIIAGSAGDAGPAPNDAKLFSWTGNASDAPIETGTFASGFNPEGIVALSSDNLTASLMGTSLIQFISDDGAATVYGDGTASKDLGQNNFKKFRTDTVALTDAFYSFNGNARTSITGTSINDSITGNPGAKTLTGGAGNDRFIYNSLRDVGHTISDFTVGQDKIVLTQLLSGIGYSGTNPIADGYVKIVQGSSSNSANSILQIDRDGPLGGAIFRPFIQIDNISATAMSNVNNFIFQ
jgi:hypothetical protein